MAEHAKHLRYVREGDIVHIETTEGLTLDAECTSYQKDTAAAGSGHVRESKLWVFKEQDLGREYAVAILDGLASTEAEQGKFPKHNELTEQWGDYETVGFIEEIKTLK